MILGEYDDNFFNLMPKLFPYNKFTMTVRDTPVLHDLSHAQTGTYWQKLIKRTIWRDHTNLLIDRQNALIEELRVLAEEGFPKAKEEWEKSVAQWGLSLYPHTSAIQSSHIPCRETPGACQGRNRGRAHERRCTLERGLARGERRAGDTNARKHVARESPIVG